MNHREMQASRTDMQASRTHDQESVFVLIVHDRPGVLNRIASAFSQRGINIINLTVGETHVQGASKMVVRARHSLAGLRRLREFLRGLIDVLEVELLNSAEQQITELCLARVGASSDEAREAVLEHVHPYRPQLRRVDIESLVLEVIATPETIDQFVRRLSEINLLDVSRTGITSFPAKRDLLAAFGPSDKPPG